MLPKLDDKLKFRFVKFFEIQLKHCFKMKLKAR